ncbi:MAG TPA: YncE family protein, partial [Armatimonadota bacterium]|nr:YncE family protein [Armatimonadota bacterium]
GGRGGIDFMMMDPRMRRVIATHPGTKSLTVLDLRTHAMTEVPTGVVNGVAVDPFHNHLFAAGGDQKLVILNRRTLAIEAQVPLNGPADDVLFDPVNGMLYVDHDDGTEIWIVDPKTARVAGSITIAGAPEVMEYDAQTNRIYQNIKPMNSVQVINPATNSVETTWSTSPVTSPHGLAIDAATQRLFTAGSGKVAVIDMKTGKVIQTVAIAPGYVDQIAFDPGRKRLYCACGNGFISVVRETVAGAELVANVASHNRAHSLAVDPRTHSVWLSYTDGKNSYLQEYRAP